MARVTVDNYHDTATDLARRAGIAVPSHQDVLAGPNAN